MLTGPQGDGVCIIGLGRFGRAFATLLDEEGHAVSAWDPSQPLPLSVGLPSFERVADSRIVVLATPVEQVGAVARALRPLLTPEHIVIDVGSVKVSPSTALAAELGDAVPWVATHPLFGPASIARGDRLRAVVCPNPRHPAATQTIRELFVSLGCSVLDLDAHEHDRRMASTHALGFFLAKGLLDAGATFEDPVTPPSSQGIARAIRSVRSDAGHLLVSLHRENPYAEAMREKALESLGRLHEALSGIDHVTHLPAASPVLATDPAFLIPNLGNRSPELREVRDLIDELDADLVDLLARRAVLSRRAQRAKAQIGAGVRDLRREAELRSARRGWARDAGLDPTRVDSVFSAVIGLSVALQEDPDDSSD